MKEGEREETKESKEVSIGAEGSFPLPNFLSFKGDPGARGAGGHFPPKTSHPVGGADFAPPHKDFP